MDSWRGYTSQRSRYHRRMTVPLLLTITAIVTFGAAVQAAIGFGAGMVAIPLLIWAGLPLEHALGVMGTTIAGQLMFKVWRYRRQIDWKLVFWPMGVGRLIGYVPGFAALWWLSQSPTAIVKQVVGAAVLLALLLQVGFRVKPREKLAAGWGWLAGISGGIGAGAVGMGGPPTVMWVLAHDWPNKQARQFLWASFLIFMPLQLAALLVLFGTGELLYMGIGVVTLPVVLLGTAGGLWLGHQLPTRQLRWLMIGLLVVLGVMSVVGPMVGSG